MARRVILLGALSAVAIAIGRLYAAQGAELLLVARSEEELNLLAADLRLRGAAKVSVLVMDLASPEPDGLEPVFAGGADIIILAYGVLSDQGLAEKNLIYAAEQLRTNFSSAAVWCVAAANILEQQKSGVLVVIGSVAGDRGRKSNHVYGAAKAGLGVLCQGIAHRLAGSGARAILIKPGLIDTPMTAHLRKTGWLWSKPEAIARIIVKAVEGKRGVVYAPWYWRVVLFVIRVMPESIFHRINL